MTEAYLAADVSGKACNSVAEFNMLRHESGGVDLRVRDRAQGA
jgi:hypothetical protein